MNVRHTRLLVVAALAAIIAACTHKELCFHHDHLVTLRLEFDWRDAPEANPAGMGVYFYPQPAGDPIVFHFDNTVGGEITLPAGEYVALTYNNDAPSINALNMHRHDLHELFTREGGLFEPLGDYNSRRHNNAPRAEQAEDERVIICPDEMWGCPAFDIKITEQGITYVCNPFDPDGEEPSDSSTVTDQLITLYPHELTCIYTYEIRHVKNIDQIARMSASLSGMAPTLRLIDEELGRECVTHPFEAVSKPEESKIVGRFITFGHHEENPQAHKMMLYVWTKDGKAYSFGTKSERFDLTQQVHDAPNRRRVHLIIDSLDVPAPLPPEAGVVPDIDEWAEVFVDFQM